MLGKSAISALGLRTDEQTIVDRVFGAGKAQPWSDELADQIMEWMGSVALIYLKAKRDASILEPYVGELSTLLDKVILERFESLRSAALDVHEDPPYHTDDRWPTVEFPVAKTVIDWAFGNLTV